MSSATPATAAATDGKGVVAFLIAPLILRAHPTSAHFAAAMKLAITASTSLLGVDAHRSREADSGQGVIERARFVPLMFLDQPETLGGREV